MTEERPATQNQIAAIHACKSRHRLSDAEYREFLQRNAGKRSSKDMTFDEAAKVLSAFNRGEFEIPEIRSGYEPLPPGAMTIDDMIRHLERKSPPTLTAEERRDLQHNRETIMIRLAELDDYRNDLNLVLSKALEIESEAKLNVQKLQSAIKMAKDRSSNLKTVLIGMP